VLIAGGFAFWYIERIHVIADRKLGKMHLAEIAYDGSDPDNTKDNEK
jgi:hypothetical protein